MQNEKQVQQPDQLGILSYQQEMGTANSEAMLRLFQSQHFVCDAPRLGQIAEDDLRANSFSYYPATTMTRRQRYSGGEVGDPVTMTESEGLGKLRAFLGESLTDIQKHGGNADLEDAINTIATKTSFIGEKELQEATHGIAELWKDYLRTGPRHQLVIPAGIIGTGEQMQKSSDYLFQRIMSNFTVEEQRKYGAQITRDLNKLQKDPNLTKIVLLDDWSISGTQLANGMGEIVTHRRVSSMHQQKIEVHMVAASPQQIDSLRLQGRPVKTWAYFRTDQSRAGEPFVTGVHSSVDFQFEHPIENVVSTRNEYQQTDEVTMPPLTNIQRNYEAYRQAYQAPATQRGHFLGKMLSRAL